MPKVVLITGVSRFLGTNLAAALAADPAVDRVIGIDATPPRRADLPRLGRTEFVRADIRNPLIAKVIAVAHRRLRVHSRTRARRHDAAARRLPEVRHRAADRGPLDDRGLRRRAA